MVSEEYVLTHADRAESHFGIGKRTRHIIETSHIFVARAHDTLYLKAHLMRQTTKHNVDTRLAQWRAIVLVHLLVHLSQRAEIMQ